MPFLKAQSFTKSWSQLQKITALRAISLLVFNCWYSTVVSVFIWSCWVHGNATYRSNIHKVQIAFLCAEYFCAIFFHFFNAWVNKNAMKLSPGYMCKIKILYYVQFPSVFRKFFFYSQFLKHKCLFRVLLRYNLLTIKFIFLKYKI